MAPPTKDLNVVSKRQKRRRLNEYSGTTRNIEVPVVESRPSENEADRQMKANNKPSSSASSAPSGSDIVGQRQRNEELSSSAPSEGDIVGQRPNEESSSSASPVHSIDNTEMGLEISNLSSNSVELHGEGSKKSENVESSCKSNVCSSDCGEKLEAEITEWMQNEKTVPHDSISRLLKRLNKHFPSLPLSAKTLIEKSTVEIFPCDDGEYVHFSNWKEGLASLIGKFYCQGSNKSVSLSVNIDGIPLYNNTTKYSAYPILVQVLEYPSHILCAGIYCSNKFECKGMPSLDEYLQRFLRDIQDICEGFETSHGNFTVSLNAFICDAPVRSALKQIVSHSGYNCCERCVQHGEYHGNTVVLLKTNSEKRSDESFTDRNDPSHHKSESASLLETVFPKMVTGFVLDYMHVACIGVMKRILSRLLSSNTKEKKVNISTQSKEILKEKLNICHKYIPTDFQRKLDGGLDIILRWKASQYRMFMLYLGIVLFSHKDIVSEEIFENFLNFSIAMRLLLTDGQDNNLGNVQQMLCSFVNGAKDIYGRSFISYNVHCLTHLTEDYLKYGNLQNVSAFPFESFLGIHVKGAVRSGYKPLQQIHSHIHKNNLNIVRNDVQEKPSQKKKQCSCNIEGHCFKKYSVVRKKANYILKSKCDTDRIADSCIQLKNGQICIIQGIHLIEDKTLIFVVKSFLHSNNLFKRPVKSCSVGIHKVRTLSEENQRVSLQDIFAKMIILPRKNKYVAILLSHTVDC